MSYKEVKRKIRSVQKVHTVTKAMEAVSAVKMRRSQHSAIEARPFALHAFGVLQRLIAKGVAHEHPLVVPRTTAGGTMLMLVVTSDRGLTGALNTLVYKKVEDTLRAEGYTKDRVHILAIGKKGYDHFIHLGFTVVDHVEHWGEGVAFGDPDALARRVLDAYGAGVYDTVHIVYNTFVSTFVQKTVTHIVLPISFDALATVVMGSAGEPALSRTLPHEQPNAGIDDYTYEPTPSAVLDTLLPYMVGVQLYHAVLEANASEHSARMVAMKSASDRARDLTRVLTRTSNRARQTHITAEVSEITGGIEAMQ